VIGAHRRQRGVAVVVAVLVVALATSTASYILWHQSLWIRQVENLADRAQADALARAAASWAAAILAADDPAVDHLGEPWARRIPPFPAERAELAGAIGDEQAKLNVNNLALDGMASARDLDAFKRLLQAIGLDAKLAEAVADWIDADEDVLPRGGAEDEYYLRLAVPYRAANQPIAELGELLRVRGMDDAALAQLRRFATALPRRTPVNVNLASPEVLVALVNGLTLSEAQVLASDRAAAPFRSLEDFAKRLPRRSFQWNEGELAVASQYFLVQGRVTVGRADVRMEALLRRDGRALPAIVWQRMR